MAKRCLAVLWLWLAFCVVRMLAQNSNLPPGSNFDLSHWSLTLPDAQASVISPARLSAGFTNSYFYTGADGAMVFWCPVTGGTTSASDDPRCELREMLDPSDNQVNWSVMGEHTLNATCRVTQLPSEKRVVIGQIHSFLGAAPPLLLLVFDNGNVEALVKLVSTQTDNTSFWLGNVGLGNPIHYQLRMADGVLTMTVNSSTQVVNVVATDPTWAQQTFYFKAGNYCLDHLGLASEGAKVRFSQLRAQHNITCLITQMTMSGGQCCLTWTSQLGRTYFLQGRVSQGDPDWFTLSPMLTAQSNLTSFCIPFPSLYHFFRVGLVVP